MLEEQEIEIYLKQEIEYYWNLFQFIIIPLLKLKN